MPAANRYCALLALGLVVAVPACRPQKREKPEPPDMSALLHAYANPSGTVTPETAPAVYAALCDRFGVTGILCDWGAPQDMACAQDDLGCSPCASLEPVFEALESAGIDLGELGGARESAHRPDAGADAGADTNKILTGEGWARLTRICGGHGPAPVAEESNGAVSLTVGFTDQGVDRVIWGDFNQCQMRIGERAIVLHGQISVDLGDEITLDGDIDLRLTIQIEGTLTADGETQQISVDLQLTFDNGPGASLLVPIDDGQHVVFLIDKDGPALRLSDGIRNLDPTELQCQGPDA